jgi:P27 family predicted phage terminase small subunit
MAECKKKLVFRCPASVKHDETKKMMLGIVRILNDKGMLDVTDIPQLHRMATAYDTYLRCLDVLAENGYTMTNGKGETVKRPETNILKESWAQYIEIAKEYGLTAKSKTRIKAMASEDNMESPLDTFLKKRKEAC